MNKRDILCVDWDERSLRVLDANFQRSGVTVRRAVLEPIPDGFDVRDPSAMGDFLRRVLGEHRIRTRRAIVDVPRQDTVLNRLSLPAGSMDEMAAMVHLQITKELPFSKDQAVIDFAVVPRADQPTADVWVAAIRVNVAEYYRQVFSNAGLTLERIGLRPYANVRSLQAAQFTQGRVVMVDVGPSMTEINILRDGQLMYTRAAAVNVPVSLASQASRDGNGDEETVDSVSIENLLIEVNRTIAAYRATDLGATIDLMVLAGTGAPDERLVQVFEDRFGITTQMLAVPRSIRWRADVAGSAAPFAATIGLALSSFGERSECFDFLHVKEPQAEHRERVKRRPLVIATIALFAGAGVVAAYQPIRARQLELATLEQEIKVLNEDEEARKEALARVADLESWQEGNVIWIDYIKKIAEVFPSNKNCYITQLEIDGDKGLITLELAAKDRFQAAEVVEAIKAIVDKKGKALFDARSGYKPDPSKIAEYPVVDEVVVTVLEVAPKPKKRRR